MIGVFLSSTARLPSGPTTISKVSCTDVLLFDGFILSFSVEDIRNIIDLVPLWTPLSLVSRYCQLIFCNGRGAAQDTRYYYFASNMLM
jgi:hypothetical protein